MKPFEIVLKEIPCLYEYQKKQLAMILISETLNAQSNLETFKIIANDGKHGIKNTETERIIMETKYALYDSANKTFVVDEDTNEVIEYNTYLEALKECYGNETIIKLK